MTIATILVVAVCIAVVTGRADDETTVVSSGAPSSSAEVPSTLPPTTGAPATTMPSLIVSSTTTSLESGPPASTMPRAAGCLPSGRVEVPCPLRDGTHAPVKASGLPSLARISFGLCVVTATPSLADCSPGVEHQAGTDPAGNLSTYLTFQRFLVIDGGLIDCARVQCELRVRARSTDGAVVDETQVEPLVYSDSPTREFDLGASEILEHQVPHDIEIKGLGDTITGNRPIIEQCVQATLATAFGTPYEHCFHVAATDIQRDGDRLRATIEPSRWAYDLLPSILSRGAPPLIDCAAPTRPCYLRALTPGEGGYVRRPVRIVGDGATAAVMTVSKTTGLANGEAVEVTLKKMPPRRWAYIVYCLDTERLQAAPPADGDGLTACIQLARLPDRSEQPVWPNPTQQLSVAVPRFLEWAGTNHDCADPRGCNLILMSGSDIYPDFGYPVRVDFSA